MHLRTETTKHKKILTLAIAVLSFHRVVIGEETPAKMTHVIIRMSGTDIAEDSFFAKPKTFWRASNRYCRTDEEPDPKNGIHGRLVINEPDGWLINLADNTAKHMPDPGPTFDCRLPIFAFNMAMVKSKIGALEVGRELDFFHENGATVVEGPKLSFEAKYYRLHVGDSVLTLVERVDIHVPIMVGLIQDEKVYTARYALWEEIPFDPKLFVLPPGLKLIEVK